MEKVAEKKKRLRTKFARHEIPSYLIYEEIDGKPVYYRGYKEVLNGVKTAEQLMGSSDIQIIINGCFLKFLNRNLDEDKYFAAAGEAGLHLKKHTNFTADIVVYEKSVLQNRPLDGKYFEQPPLVVIEIDIQAETAELGMTQMDYYSLKTQKSLDFGVKEVFWFFSGVKKVVFAKQGHDWITTDWTKQLTLLNTHTFSLTDLLTKEGWQF